MIVCQQVYFNFEKLLQKTAYVPYNSVFHTYAYITTSLILEIVVPFCSQFPLSMAWTKNSFSLVWLSSDVEVWSPFYKDFKSS